MTRVWQRLKKSKVLWTSIGGILVATGSCMAGELEISKAVQIVFSGLLAIGFRDTLAKAQNGGS